MKDHLVLNVVGRFLIPFILLYALYIQLHGEITPGGGFQAGVIFAAGFILYCLLKGLDATLALLPLRHLAVLASLGVLLYAGVGVLCMLRGGNFLDYDTLSSVPARGQHLGILLIELGVGVTVFSTMLMLFVLFVARKMGGKS